MGSLQESTCSTGARMGACYRAPCKVGRRRDESDWRSAAFAGPPGRVFETSKAFAAHFEFLRRIQTVSSQPISSEEDHPDPVASGRDWLILAEAVEQKEEEDGDQSVDERRDYEVHVKPRLRLCKENTAGQDDQGPMHNKKKKKKNGTPSTVRRVEGRPRTRNGGI